MSDPRAILRTLGLPDPPSSDPILERLALGLALHGSPETALAGISLQVQALIDAGRDRGASLNLLAPMLTLERLLATRSLGGSDPLLDAYRSAASRPQAPPRIWDAKAFLVLACERRLAWGDPPREAVAALTRDLPPLASLKGTVVEWRNTFGRKGKNAAPRDGDHWEILREGRAHLARERALLKAAGEAFGREGYVRLLAAAAARLPDI